MSLEYFYIRFNDIFDGRLLEIVEEEERNGMVLEHLDHGNFSETNISVRQAFTLFQKYANMDKVFIEYFDILLCFERTELLPGE